MKVSIPTGRFKNDLARIQKRRWNLEKLNAVLSLLEIGRPLPTSARPHKLSGEYGGLWECHLEQDWLLIYDITDGTIILHRTGNHADLFK